MISKFLSLIPLACVLFVLLSCTDKCYTNPDKAITKGHLSPELAVVAIDERRVACPQFATGDISRCKPSPKNVDDLWDASLPDETLFSMFFQSTQFSFVKDLLTDLDFVAALSAVPDPDERAITWYNERKDALQGILLDIDDTPSLNTNELESTQLKLITVFHSISSWTFCSNTKQLGNLTVHGEYDPGKRDIIIYSSACGAGKIYGSNIRSLAKTYKYYFIGSHEFGHVIDDLSGKLNNKNEVQRTMSEHRANYSGLVITMALSRLFLERFRLYKVSIENVDKSKLMSCDIRFVDYHIKRWEKVETYFGKLVTRAKKNIIKQSPVKALKREEFSTFGCLEKI